MPSGCRLLITCIAERQSYNTGLDLARLLAEMGHRVTFVGPSCAEHQQHVEANGFEFLGVGPARPKFQQGGPLQRLRDVRALNREMSAAVEEFAARYEHSFDLAFMDVNAWAASPVLARTGVPTLAFCSGYTSTFSLRYPPVIWCRRVPGSANGAGWTEASANLAWWTYAILRRRVPTLLRNPVSLAVAWRTRRQAARHGWRFCLGDWGVRPRIPEIAFAYKPIDWPVQQGAATRLYLDRRAPRAESFGGEWRHGLDGDRPLVYCSLGALVGPEIWQDRERQVLHGYWRRFLSYLQVVVGAFADRPDWQLLIAAGHLAAGFDPAALPSNVQVRQWVPQDEVLGRAAAAITAGGSATIRDCVRFGVPMLVFPAWADHFGNAARVAHARLGLDGGDFRKLTSTRLAALVEAALGDPEIAAAMARAKQSWDAGHDGQAEELRRFVARHTAVRL